MTDRLGMSHPEVMDSYHGDETYGLYRHIMLEYWSQKQCKKLLNPVTLGLFPPDAASPARYFQRFCFCSSHCSAFAEAGVGRAGRFPSLN